MYNVFAYVLRGKGTLDKKQSEIIKEGQMVTFNKDGEFITTKASEGTTDTFQLLLIGGIPIDEPIARYGPFVMNTKQEIYRALEDYRNGKLGVISH
jgi:redox-sensitive bicupin YhaK (pirin superfamily)